MKPIRTPSRKVPWFRRSYGKVFLKMGLFGLMELIVGLFFGWTLAGTIAFLAFIVFIALAVLSGVNNILKDLSRSGRVISIVVLFLVVLGGLLSVISGIVP